MEQVEGNGQAASSPAAPALAVTKPSQSTFVGRVASNKMDKTVIVRVEKVKRHRLYHRNIHYHVKYYAHDEDNNCGMGDLVRIVASRPVSKTKRWRVTEILERGGIERTEV